MLFLSKFFYLSKLLVKFSLNMQKKNLGGMEKSEVWNWWVPLNQLQYDEISLKIPQMIHFWIDPFFHQNWNKLASTQNDLSKGPIGMNMVHPFSKWDKFRYKSYHTEPGGGGGHMYFRLDIILVKELWKHTLNMYFSGMKIGKKYTSGPRYWNVPVLVNTGTFLMYQYCLKMWYLHSLECAGVIKKLTILERINGLVLSNTRVPVSATLTFSENRP